jgi:uncharacterized protein
MSGVAGGDQWADMATHRTILRCCVGSTAHGLHLGGTDDRDEMAVCVETYEAATGLGPPFEQHIYRTAAVREGRHDARSGPGDLDLTIFSLRKFLRLALDGNPTVLLLLFARPVAADARGMRLRELAPAIVSRAAGPRFLGYLQAQRERLLGLRGQKRVKRPELEAAHGYDTKYAMHMLRLGQQGCELLETGRLALPMSPGMRDYLLAVRRGELSMDDCVRGAEVLEQQMKTLIAGGAVRGVTSPLREHPDRDAVEAWMLQTYWEAWRADLAVNHQGRLRGGGTWSARNERVPLATDV